ncbi:MAG: hypothetical protein NTW97_03085, partial [Candidatus Krumholzibacteria bacterium]|nr:hypothetical protein [Candidatus Krumholzibacteria bacterium]
EILTSSTVYCAILMFLMIVAGYYALREHYNPGYLRAVWTNEVAARYLSAPQLEHHPGGFLYYARELAVRQFSSWLFFVPIGIALIFFNASSPMKPFAALLLFCSAFAFVTISFAKTKMQWYAAPLLPLLSIIVGAGLSDIYAHVRKALALHGGGARLVFGTCFVAAIFCVPYAKTIGSIRNEADDASARYGDFMKKIASSKDRPGSFSVMHQGWSPQIYFYAQRLAEAEGIAITRKFSPTQLRIGEVVMTCQSGSLEWIREHFDYEVLDSYEDCSMIRIRSVKRGESGESP